VTKDHDERFDAETTTHTLLGPAPLRFDAAGGIVNPFGPLYFKSALSVNPFSRTETIR